MIYGLLAKLFGTKDFVGPFRWHDRYRPNPVFAESAMQRAKAKRERKNARRLKTWTGRR